MHLPQLLLLSKNGAEPDTSKKSVSAYASICLGKIAPLKNGFLFLTIPSSHKVLWIASLTMPTRLLLTEKAIENNSDQEDSRAKKITLKKRRKTDGEKKDQQKLKSGVTAFFRPRPES